GADDHGERDARRRSHSRTIGIVVWKQRTTPTAGRRGRPMTAHARRVTVALFAVVLAGGFIAPASRAIASETTAVTAVDTIGMTVSDMDRAVQFYTSVLTFQKVSDTEVAGREYELMEGVFGARMRIVRLR